LNGETAPEIDVDAGEDDDKIFQEFVAKYENRKGKKSKVG
jgi:hypothetical protein